MRHTGPLVGREQVPWELHSTRGYPLASTAEPEPGQGLGNPTGSKVGEPGERGEGRGPQELGGVNAGCSACITWSHT